MIGAQLLSVLLVALSGVSYAAAPVKEIRYVEPGAKHAWSIATAPLSAELALALAAEAMTAARRFRGGLPVEAAAIAAGAGGLVGALQPETFGPWQPPVSAPFPPPPADRRVAALRVRVDFTVGDELAEVSVLRVRARYMDSLVATLNGKLVATRLAPPPAAGAFATLPKGPEWETIFIPVAKGVLARGKNELLLEVRPSSSRLQPQVDVEVVGTSAVRLVRGPLLVRVGETQATLSFETDAPTTAVVKWGVGDALTKQVASSSGTRHTVVLAALPRDAEITYQVELPSDVAPARTFHTAPARGKSVRFVVFGDSRSGHDVHARLTAKLMTERPDFVVATGDAVVYGHDEADWQRFFTIEGAMLGSVPLYPSCGNHDLGATGADQRTFEDLFPIARAPGAGYWYSVDVGDVHVALLDSNRYDDPAQKVWLEQDLAQARARGAKTLFAATHHGPWSRGPHGGNPIAKAELVPILAKYGVAMLFAGHDHIYQRGEALGLRYMVSGGGGAPLYPIVCKPELAGCDPDDGAALAVPEHHYVVVDVTGAKVRVCPKRLDGSPLEPCLTFDGARAPKR